MSTTLPGRTGAALLGIGLALVAPAYPQETVFQADYTVQTPGSAPNADVGAMEVWTGPPGETPWGTGGILSLDGIPGSPKQALVLSDAQPGEGPVLHLNVPDFFTQTTPDLAGVVRIRFSVPVGGKYIGVIFMGGYWRDSAATLRLADGKAQFFGVEEGNDAFRDIARYETNQWIDLKVVFDFANNSYDAWWNGENVAKGVPWVSRASNEPWILIQADNSDFPRTGEPVLHVASAEVSLVKKSPLK